MRRVMGRFPFVALGYLPGAVCWTQCRAQGPCWVSQPLRACSVAQRRGWDSGLPSDPGILTGAALDPGSQHVMKFKSSLLHEVEEADMEKGVSAVSLQEAQRLWLVTLGLAQRLRLARGKRARGSACVSKSPQL